MITRLFNNPHVLYQTWSDDMSIPPEPAIAACTDASGLIILSQEGRDLLINPESVNELCRLLKKAARCREPVMTCATCGGSVLWMGPITALTHTECQQCGAINNQEPEHAGEEESHD